MKTGKVGKTTARHTSAEFIAFLRARVAKTKWATDTYIVLDNLSAHKTQTVRDFLAAHPA